MPTDSMEARFAAAYGVASSLLELEQPITLEALERTVSTVAQMPKFNDLDVSVFVDNLFDSKTNFSLNRDTRNSPIFFGGSFRPRTIGLTVTYRR